MTDKTNFVAKAQAQAEVERQSLEREIALDRTSGFFSRRGYGLKDAFLEALVDAMAHFWIAVFPILLVAGIVVYAIATYLGITIWGAITLIAFLAIGLFALAHGMR